MAGYYKMPDKTAETIIDGWLHTGDIGYIDSRGYVFIKDRIRDLVVTGGFNVIRVMLKRFLVGTQQFVNVLCLGWMTQNGARLFMLP